MWPQARNAGRKELDKAGRTLPERPRREHSPAHLRFSLLASRTGRGQCSVALAPSVWCSVPTAPAQHRGDPPSLRARSVSSVLKALGRLCHMDSG